MYILFLLFFTVIGWTHILNSSASDSKNRPHLTPDQAASKIQHAFRKYKNKEKAMLKDESFKTFQSDAEKFLARRRQPPAIDESFVFLDDLLEKSDPVKALEDLKNTDLNNYKRLCVQIKEESFYRTVEQKGLKIMTRNKLIQACDAVYLEQAKIGQIQQGSRVESTSVFQPLQLKSTAAERAQREAKEQARREAEERARIEAEEHDKKIAKEKSQKFLEERTKKEEDEERARREAEERLRKARESKEKLKKKKEDEERARREAEERALLERQKGAATKLQSAFRGYKARQTFADLKKEKARIEAEERTLLERQKGAATKLQSAFRGYKARQTFADLKKEKARIEAEERTLLERQKGAATKLQSAFRGYKARQTFADLKKEKARIEAEEQAKREATELERQKRDIKPAVEHQQRVAEEARKALDTLENEETSEPDVQLKTMKRLVNHVPEQIKNATGDTAKRKTLEEEYNTLKKQVANLEDEFANLIEIIKSIYTDLNDYRVSNSVSYIDNDTQVSLALYGFEIPKDAAAFLDYTWEYMEGFKKYLRKRARPLNIDWAPFEQIKLAKGVLEKFTKNYENAKKRLEEINQELIKLTK